jgi:transcriptional regulator GlxA family with amidase domain
MKTEYNTKRKVGIFIFHETEELDLCGPLEVFAAVKNGDGSNAFEVYTIAETTGPIICTNGLSVNPTFTLAECPQPDIFVIVGGRGARREIHNQALVNWIKNCAEKSELTLTVCLGSFFLARAGLLDGLTATTHRRALDELAEISPHIQVVADQRFVDNGRIITSAGVSAGIDAAFHIVSRLSGSQAAQQAAEYIEYDWVLERRI